MKDKIIQISSNWKWMGSWEDSHEEIYGLGESGILYRLEIPQTIEPDTGVIKYGKPSWSPLIESPDKE